MWNSLVLSMGIHHFSAIFDVSKSTAGAELEAEDDEPAESIELGTAYPWEGSDRDYKYEEVRFKI